MLLGSNTLAYYENYGRKKFYNIGPRTVYRQLKDWILDTRQPLSRHMFVIGNGKEVLLKGKSQYGYVNSTEPFP